MTPFTFETAHRIGLETSVIIKHAEQEGNSLKVTVEEDGYYKCTKYLQIFDPKDFALTDFKQASQVTWASHFTSKHKKPDPRVAVRF